MTKIYNREYTCPYRVYTDQHRPKLSFTSWSRSRRTKTRSHPRAHSRVHCADPFFFACAFTVLPAGRTDELTCASRPRGGRRRPSTAAQAAGGQSCQFLHTCGVPLLGPPFFFLTVGTQTTDRGRLGVAATRQRSRFPILHAFQCVAPPPTYTSRWGLEPHSLRRPQSACVL